MMAAPRLVLGLASSRLASLATTSASAPVGSEIKASTLMAVNTAPKSLGGSRWPRRACIVEPRAPAGRVLTPTIMLCATRLSADSAPHRPRREPVGSCADRSPGRADRSRELLGADRVGGHRDR